LSLPSDLLAQAQFLVGREPKKPKQASLRRAVSAAYYALFHLLTEDAARLMFGGSDAAALRAVVCRAFQHATMKRAAQGFGAGTLGEPWKSLLDTPSPELKLVAGTFVDLQQQRHQADYDFGRPLIRTEATDLVERVEAAIRTWKAIRKTGASSKSYSLEARVFLAALLVHDWVSRR
jgi:hypothetical protein